MNTSSSRVDDVSDSVLQSAVSKVKRHILPLFVIMFIVNYIDRVNIGFVRSHMEHDLGIGAAAYGFGAGLFFIAYALFEVPSNILLQKVGARIWLTRIMLTWGLVAAGMAFIQTETHFYILRFLLGVAEAGFFPGVIYYFTRWLPGVERGKAIAIFLSGPAERSLALLRGALAARDRLASRAPVYLYRRGADNAAVVGADLCDGVITLTRGRTGGSDWLDGLRDDNRPGLIFGECAPDTAVLDRILRSRAPDGLRPYLDRPNRAAEDNFMPASSSRRFPQAQGIA